MRTLYFLSPPPSSLFPFSSPPPFPLFPLSPIFSTSLLYIWAGRVSKLCLPIRCVKRQIRCNKICWLYTIIIMHRSRASPALHIHSHTTPVHTTTPRHYGEHTRRQPLRQDSPRRIANVEIAIMLIIWPINYYSTVMVSLMFYQWIDMCVWRTLLLSRNDFWTFLLP